MTRQRSTPLTGTAAAVEQTLRDWTVTLRPIWEQLPQETEAQYDQFAAYLHMGTGYQRTHRRVAELFPGISAATVRNTAQLFRWSRRAAAYDDFHGKAPIEDRSNGVDLRKLVAQLWGEGRNHYTFRKATLGKFMFDMFLNRVLAAEGLRWDDERGEVVPTGEAPRPLSLSDNQLLSWGKAGAAFMADALAEVRPADAAAASVVSADDEVVEALPMNLADAADDEIDRTIAKLKGVQSRVRTHTRQ